MRLIISFKEKPSEEIHQKLIAVGAVLCGQSYYAKGQIADMLQVMAIADGELTRSIVLEGDRHETQEA